MAELKAELERAEAVKRRNSRAANEELAGQHKRGTRGGAGTLAAAEATIRNYMKWRTLCLGTSDRGRNCVQQRKSEGTS